MDLSNGVNAKVIGEISANSLTLVITRINLRILALVKPM